MNEKFQITVVFGSFDGKEEADKYLKYIKYLINKTLSSWIVDISMKGSHSK